ncbi:MAG: plasmid pRiA4b ORF-3 family protein [Verrucomicrobiaceae bacterium]|nr:MAG: plasmid pRiA4b ORF-3 family protein [Verrucomicrobiaceae bacterium]
MAKAKDETRVQVKVFLYGIQPKIWRQFSIAGEANFLEFSDAIQAMMGWENKHPHEFRHGKGKRLVDVIGPVGLEDQTIGEFQDELKVTLADYIGKKRVPMRMLYRYDFADEWIHEVVLEKWVAGEGGPISIAGERNCPPEDCGGTFQYMQALHGDIQWMNPGYDPEAFDPKAVSFEKKATRKRR